MPCFCVQTHFVIWDDYSEIFFPPPTVYSSITAVPLLLTEFQFLLSVCNAATLIWEWLVSSWKNKRFFVFSIKLQSGSRHVWDMLLSRSVFFPLWGLNPPRAASCCYNQFTRTHRGLRHLYLYTSRVGHREGQAGLFVVWRLKNPASDWKVTTLSHSKGWEHGADLKGSVSEICLFRSI